MNIVKNDTMQGLNELKELEVAVIEIQTHLMRGVRNTTSRKKPITIA